ISGFGEMLYVQVDNERDPFSNGLYRSTDKGTTWQSIGGPSHDRDTRFVVSGCNGGVVYAFDNFGNVLKTRNGGDGAIYEPPVEPQIYGNPIVFSGPICSTSYASLLMENLYCMDDSIVSAVIADTASTIISSGALTVSATPSFPLYLPSGKKDSLRFTWQPSKIFHRDTTVSIKVKVKYYSKVLRQSFDTIVTVSVHAIGEGPSAEVSPIAADFGKISFCNPHDTLITIRNIGCDTLFITSANIPPSA